MLQQYEKQQVIKRTEHKPMAAVDPKQVSQRIFFRCFDQNLQFCDML